MTITKRWLLPEGVDEILPPRAILLEQMCRKLIDLFSSWGYEFVIPPMMEYLESLLTATGEDLDLQTYKITDQLSGRLMGIRADITPQVARIDAHLLKRNIPTRLCYLGSVLHSRTNNSGDSRSPLQLGAELFGHEGVSSDIEIVKLMLATLDAVRISNICLDVGHIGIFRSLISKSQLNSMQESEVFEIVKRKAKDELKIFYKKLKINDDSSKAMLDLIDLHGDAGILDDAIHAFDKLSPDIRKYVNEVKTLTDSIIDKFDVSINIDLSELRGYNYHTGMIYTAFVPNEGKGIAFGGRYDDIGSAFGKARPATGFSTDMKQLLELQNISEDTPDKIFAPVDDNDSLQKKITELREQGKIVIQELEGQNATAKEMNCNQTLVCENDQWVVKENKK
ncbi:MAG TPA: ATP phosphoribosyltransferase regulatory subunit [Gammaproteobacteria bacterium]|nr:ATP phosphoribosyltransferase regulatory subunit [Gammaproteobacteria bacterium]|tara:strand:+ start:2763 stop:3947 length:1185 start_codon:yes stop_codon:yes gene_type:complete